MLYHMFIYHMLSYFILLYIVYQILKYDIISYQIISYILSYIYTYICICMIIYIHIHDGNDKTSHSRFPMHSFDRDHRRLGGLHDQQKNSQSRNCARPWGKIFGEFREAENMGFSEKNGEKNSCYLAKTS